jgi:hypothetical protein
MKRSKFLAALAITIVTSGFAYADSGAGGAWSVIVFGVCVLAAIVVALVVIGIWVVKRKRSRDDAA